MSCFGIPIRAESKRKWLRMECGFHYSPDFYFSAGGKHLFYTRGSKVPLGDEWRITYNPWSSIWRESIRPIQECRTWVLPANASAEEIIASIDAHCQDGSRGTCTDVSA